MSTNKELLQLFNAKADQVKGIVQETLNQIINHQMEISSHVEEDPDLQQFLKKQSYPLVRVGLVSRTPATVRHLLLMEPELVASFYAWMIGSEVEKSIGEEQLEGFQEGIMQVVGQLQTALPESGIDDVSVESVDSAKAMLKADVSPAAVRVTYRLSEKDTRFRIDHLFWSVEPAASADKEMEAEAAESSAPTDVHPVEFEPISGNGHHDHRPRNIDMLMGVELDVNVELGRKKMLIKDVLKLGKGSMVELDKAAGEPLGLFINGRKFAEGEVVVVDDQFGIRITQLVGPRERIKNLG